MSTALKTAARIFLILGLLSCTYWFFAAYKIYSSPVGHDYISKRMNVVIETDSYNRGNTQEDTSRKLQPYYEELKILEDAVRTNIIIGVASLSSAILSFLLLYSQGVILKRSELLEEMYKQKET